MNSAAIQCLQAIAYALIETESMKAANSERADKGLAQAYNESAFFTVAERMSGRVNELISYV